MKRFILFFVAALLLQFIYIITPVFPENEADALAIKKVVENYLGGIAKRDLNSIMNQISANFSEVDKEGNVINYARFKSNVEDKIIKKHKNISISDVKISGLDVKDNKASLEMEYKFKGFSLVYKDNTNMEIRNQVSLIKKNGSWKIMQVKNEYTYIGD